MASSETTKDQIDRLRYLIETRRITHDEAGAGIGVSGTRIGQWLGRKDQIPNHRVEAIIKYFICDPDWFRTGNGLPFRNGRVSWMSDDLAEAERINGNLIDRLSERSERIDRLRLQYAPNFPASLGWSETDWYEKLNNPDGLPDHVLDQFFVAIGLKTPPVSATPSARRPDTGRRRVR